MTLSQATFSVIGKTSAIRWQELKPNLDERFWSALRAGLWSSLAAVAILMSLVGGAALVKHSADAQKSTLIAWLQQAESDRDKAKQELSQAESLLANQQTYTDFLRQLSTHQARPKKQKL